MRARITLGDAKGCEWIIVSRWGADGRYLSVARSFRAAWAGESAPIDLAPVWTAVARQLRLPHASHTCFSLQRTAPARVGMAGAFTPAEGHVRLSGDHGTLRLFTEGRYPWQDGKLAWRLTATRKPWIGEYIERVIS